MAIGQEKGRQGDSEQGDLRDLFPSLKPKDQKSRRSREAYDQPVAAGFFARSIRPGLVKATIGKRHRRAR